MHRLTHDHVVVRQYDRTQLDSSAIVRLAEITGANVVHRWRPRHVGHLDIGERIQKEVKEAQKIVLPAVARMVNLEKARSSIALSFVSVESDA